MIRGTPRRRGGVLAVHGALIREIETLTITQGQGVGAPMRLFAWEKRFLRGAFSPDVSSAALLSIARGNGKTALCAAIATAAIDGMLAAISR